MDDTPEVEYMSKVERRALLRMCKRAAEERNYWAERRIRLGEPIGDREKELDDVINEVAQLIRQYLKPCYHLESYLLRYILGIEHNEISRMLGITLSNSYARVGKTSKMLQIPAEDGRAVQKRLNTIYSA